MKVFGFILSVFLVASCATKAELARTTYFETLQVSVAQLESCLREARNTSDAKLLSELIFIEEGELPVNYMEIDRTASTDEITALHSVQLRSESCENAFIDNLETVDLELSDLLQNFMEADQELFQLLVTEKITYGQYNVVADKLGKELTSRFEAHLNSKNSDYLIQHQTELGKREELSRALLALSNLGANNTSSSFIEAPNASDGDGLGCLTYLNTGKSYKVNARVVRGSELNRVTQSFNYKAFSRYVVTFWADDQVTIIEMPYLLSDELPTIGIEGVDQSERRWRVSRNTSYCF